MGSQWDNFLRNLGEWRGSFTTLDAEAKVVESTASILSLEQGEEERLVRFRLRRFADGDGNGVPIREIQQDYRSLGRHVVFFDSGSFCKGSLQVAPGTAFGAEFGFVHRHRRHRLVQLHQPAGAFEQLVLIREFRTGHDAAEQPPLEPSALQGAWVGEAQTIQADWPEAERNPCQVHGEQTASAGFQLITELAGQTSQISLKGSGAVLSTDSPMPQRFTLLPDGGYHLTPQQVSHREAFQVEAGWLAAPDLLERLIRSYDASGAWIAATQMVLHRP